MLVDLQSLHVYVAAGITDMRKAINGLSAIVQEEFELDPFSGSIFVFCNRRKNTIKALYYDINGFCLFQKRLERDRFQWPKSGEGHIQITHRELGWLLDGLNLKQPHAHLPVTYKSVI